MLLLADRQATAATLCKIGDPSSLSHKVGGLPRLIVRLALLRAELERADSPSDKPEICFYSCRIRSCAALGPATFSDSKMIGTCLSDSSGTYYDC
jgi:hypothetical protein